MSNSPWAWARTTTNVITWQVMARQEVKATSRRSIVRMVNNKEAQSCSISDEQLFVERKPRCDLNSLLTTLARDGQPQATGAGTRTCSESQQLSTSAHSMPSKRCPQAGWPHGAAHHEPWWTFPLVVPKKESIVKSQSH